nr:hypothetical protein 16 [Saccharospirillaceae bacterium]
MSIYKRVAVLLLVALPIITFAYDEKSEWTTVSKIYVKANGNSPFVVFNNNALPGCYKDQGAYLPASDEQGANRVYSGLLSAMHSGSQVQVFYTYNTNSDGWGMCDIYAVYFND